MKIFKICLALFVPLVLLASLLFLTTGAGSYKVYVIHTGSMSPHIPSGSAVLVHEGHYHVGQVITFTEDGLTVTHRLVSFTAQGLTVTKGDANSTNDPWHVPKSQIIGGVVVAPRDVGYVITYLKNPLGLGSLVLAILAVWQIWSLAARADANAESSSHDSRRQRRARARAKAPLEGDDVAALADRELVLDAPGPLLMLEAGVVEVPTSRRTPYAELVEVSSPRRTSYQELLSAAVPGSLGGAADPS